jgi:hypothetical protein
LGFTSLGVALGFTSLFPTFLCTYNVMMLVL